MRTQLSYRILPALAPEHRIGRWLVKWLSIACAIQAAMTLLGYIGANNAWRPARFSSNYGYGNDDGWLIDAVIKIATCLGAFLVMITCFGMFLRGRAFRWYAILSLLLLAVAKLANDVFPSLNPWATLINALHAGSSIRLYSGDLTNMLSLSFSKSDDALLPAITALIFSRKWIAEALAAGETEASGFGLKFASLTACVTGSAGMLVLLYFLTSGVYAHGDVMEYARPRNFNLTWTYCSMILLYTCSAAALVGGWLMLHGRTLGQRLVLWQARVAVIVNTVNLFFVVAVLVILGAFRQNEVIPGIVIVRLFSLTIDIILWLYVGSRSVDIAMRQRRDERHAEIPMATTAAVPIATIEMPAEPSRDVSSAAESHP